MFRFSQLLATSFLVGTMSPPGIAWSRSVSADSGEALKLALANAKAGDNIVLASGNYDDLVIRGVGISPNVTIDASRGQFTSVVINDVRQFSWLGGLVLPVVNIQKNKPAFQINRSQGVKLAGAAFRADGQGVGIDIRNSGEVSIVDGQFDGLLRGIVFRNVAKGSAKGNVFRNMTSDGINIVSSVKISIIGNRCIDFAADGDFHPDCIQGWSEKGKPPVADILIEANIIDGRMQGISFFDHAAGGFDRITVRNNQVTTGYPNAIALSQCRNCMVSDNAVRTSPGARFKSKIRVNRTAGAVQESMGTVVKNNDVKE